MASRRGPVPGLQYHPARPPAPPMSELLCFRRPLATRLRLRAAVLALAHSAPQVRRPMTAMSCRTASSPRLGKRVVLAVCKFPRLRLGPTRVRYCVPRSKRRTLRSRRVLGRMRRSVDARFRATQTRMCFFLFFLMYALSTDRSTVRSPLNPLKRDSDRLNIVISYAISGWQRTYISFAS